MTSEEKRQQTEERMTNDLQTALWDYFRWHGVDLTRYTRMTKSWCHKASRELIDRAEAELR